MRELCSQFRTYSIIEYDLKKLCLIIWSKPLKQQLLKSWVYKYFNKVWKQPPRKVLLKGELQSFKIPVIFEIQEHLISRKALDGCFRRQILNFCVTNCVMKQVYYNSTEHYSELLFLVVYIFDKYTLVRIYLLLRCSHISQF